MVIMRVDKQQKNIDANTIVVNIASAAIPRRVALRLIWCHRSEPWGDMVCDIHILEITVEGGIVMAIMASLLIVKPDYPGVETYVRLEGKNIASIFGSGSTMNATPL